METIYIAIGVILIISVLVIMTVEWIEYRRYQAAAAAVTSMGEAIQKSWLAMQSHLNDVMTAQAALATDSEAKTELLHLLNLRLEGLDTIVQSYGEVLNVKVLSALLPNKE